MLESAQRKSANASTDHLRKSRSIVAKVGTVLREGIPRDTDGPRHRCNLALGGDNRPSTLNTNHAFLTSPNILMFESAQRKSTNTSTEHLRKSRSIVAKVGTVLRNGIPRATDGPRHRSLLVATMSEAVCLRPQPPSPYSARSEVLTNHPRQTQWRYRSGYCEHASLKRLE